MGQNLFGGKESLTVRWANDDPNPTAIHRVKREREDVIVDASEHLLGLQARASEPTRKPTPFTP